MGGFGSGNHSWKRARPNLVEDAFALDIRPLVRTGQLTPGAAVTGLWDIYTPVGDRRMMIGYHGDLTGREDATVTLALDIGGVEYDQRVCLTVTEPHLGGLRLWFLCPVTGKRARILYLPQGKKQFASREAYGLTYRSQGESDLFRSITRAQKIRARLGGDLSIHSPFPERPRGMHRRTYEHLRDTALKIERAALAELMVKEAALERRIADSGPLRC